jgi:hypothetical protein
MGRRFGVIRTPHDADRARDAWLDPPNDMFRDGDDGEDDDYEPDYEPDDSYWDDRWDGADDEPFV